MGRLLTWVLLAVLIAVVGGALYLMFAEPPYEPVRVEKAVPNGKLGG
jgi:hypothetical protein